MSNTDGLLSIGDLAARTGLAAPTLRMWEARHGFPPAERLPSGHRRYRPDQVELVKQVLAERERGLSLGAAIAGVVDAAGRPPGSVFGGLRRAGASTRRLEKWALVALSHAIEDEYAARGGGGLLLGAFQRAGFYRRSERRWRDLGRIADVSLVMARFHALKRPRVGPIEVPIASRDPLVREWAVVCDAPQFAACFAGVEVAPAEAGPDARRPFEVAWSFEPARVREIAGTAIAIASGSAPRDAERARSAIAHRPGASDPEAALAAAERMVGYVAAASRAPRLRVHE